MKCSFDLETTSRSVYDAEIIEGYFLLDDGKDYHYKSKVDVWSDQAAEIHKIKHSDMLSYPDKKDALRNLLIWIRDNNVSEFICFSNQNNMDGFYTYDIAVIKMQLFYLTGNHTIFYKYFNDNPISVHTMARKAAQDGLFSPIKRKSDTGRMVQSLTQENTYKALFGKSYNNAHNCVIDTKMMRQIYDELIRLRHETTSFFI